MGCRAREGTKEGKLMGRGREVRNRVKGWRCVCVLGTKKGATVSKKVEDVVAASSE